MIYLRFAAVLLLTSSLTLATIPICNLPSIAPDGVGKKTTSTGFDVGEPLQTTTRRAKLELSGETIPKSELSFDGLVAHLARHFEGTAGSQFNRDVFPNAEALAKTIYEALPDRLRLDADGRVELTLPLKKGTTPVGWTGVVSLADLRAAGVPVRREARLPGGIRETIDVNGQPISGSWYPETNRDGTPVQPPNPKFKFVADALIADAPQAPTDRITVVINKNREGKPEVLTSFPGDNAPAQPARIGKFNVDTIGNGPETQYWNNHVFLSGKPSGTGPAHLNIGGKVLEFEPARLQSIKTKKFTLSPYESSVTKWKTPEELLKEKAIVSAFQLLDPVTSNGEATIPQRVRDELSALGVTVHEYDPKVGRLAIGYTRRGETFGFGGIVETQPNWQRGSLKSASGFTGVPTVPGSPRRTDTVNLVFQVVEGKLVPVDMHAGTYAPSGPPVVIAEAMVKLKPKDLMREIEKAYSAPEGERPPYTKFWKKEELLRSVDFWQKHAKTTGQGIEPMSPDLASLQRADGQPVPRIDSAPSTSANRFLSPEALTHVTTGEVVPKPPGETGPEQVWGGHTFAIVEESIAKGETYRLNPTEMRRLPGGEKLKGQDKKNILGEFAPNADGTYTIVWSMKTGSDAGGQPTWSKGKTSTVFPPGWSANKIDGAARELARTKPHEEGPDGLKSYFGFVNGVAIQLIMQNDRVLTVYPTGGGPPNKLKAPPPADPKSGKLYIPPTWFWSQLYFPYRRTSLYGA